MSIGAVLSTNLDDLLPGIRRRREEIEHARRLPRDLVDQLRGAGLFRLPVPRAIGGDEATPADLMRAIETVATADGSTGWCAMIGISANMAAGCMDEAGAREVFADPSIPAAGIAAPSGAAVREDGGLRVSGRWQFTSGITHVDWVWAGCLIMEDGKPKMTPAGPEIVHVCMPVGDIEIHDTWHVSGLCGTGSNDVSAKDVFVPHRRVFALLDPTNHRPEPLYQMPGMATFALQLVSVSLGIARAALDDLAELAQTKVPSMRRAVLADAPFAHIELARAEAALGAARAMVYDAVDMLWRTVSSGSAPTSRQCAHARLAATHGVATAASVTRTANTLAGGTSIYSSSSLQRHARDAEAITHHFSVAPSTWEDAGRVLLGRPPVAPVF